MNKDLNRLVLVTKPSVSSGLYVFVFKSSNLQCKWMNFYHINDDTVSFHESGRKQRIVRVVYKMIASSQTTRKTLGSSLDTSKIVGMRLDHPDKISSISDYFTHLYNGARFNITDEQLECWPYKLRQAYEDAQTNVFLEFL